MRGTAGAVAAVMTVAVLAGCGGGQKPAAKVADPQAAVLEEARNAPPAVPATRQTKAQARSERIAARIQRQLLRQANRPRRVYLQIKGTAAAATVTFTATGGGTSQRTVQVPAQWGWVGIAKLRPGDFAYVSAQNEGEYGSVSCRIVEASPSGERHIAPATTSSGAYAITDCNGTVR